MGSQRVGHDWVTELNWILLRASQVALVVKNIPADAGDMRRRFDPWVGKIPWRKAWQPTPVFFPWTEELGGSAKSWTQLKQLGTSALLTSFPLLKQAFPLLQNIHLPWFFSPLGLPLSLVPQVLIHYVLITHTHTHTHTCTSSRDLALELWTYTSKCLLDAFTLLSYSHGNSANPQQNLGSFCHLLLSRYSGFSWTLSLPPDSSGSQFWGFL